MYLELHGAESVEDLSQVFSDHGPGDLVVALSCGLHRVPRHVVERYDVGQDAYRLIEGTKPAGRGQGVTVGMTSQSIFQYYSEIYE